MNELTDQSASHWVRRFAPLIPSEGHVLDLACGSGRHTRLMAALGHTVEAVDNDPAVLEPLAGIERVHTRLADLEGGPWPYYSQAFDGIVVTDYLWRPLIPSLFATLGEGGVLIYETFMAGNELLGRPTSPEHLLRQGELLDLVQRKRFTVISFEQGKVTAPRPAVIQRICARRGRPVMLPGEPMAAPPAAS